VTLASPLISRVGTGVVWMQGGRLRRPGRRIPPMFARATLIDVCPPCLHVPSWPSYTTDVCQRCPGRGCTTHVMERYRIHGNSVGADLSRPPPIYRPPPLVYTVSCQFIHPNNLPPTLAFTYFLQNVILDPPHYHPEPSHCHPERQQRIFHAGSRDASLCSA